MSIDLSQTTSVRISKGLMAQLRAEVMHRHGTTYRHLTEAVEDAIRLKVANMRAARGATA